MTEQEAFVKGIRFAADVTCHWYEPIAGAIAERLDAEAKRIEEGKGPFTGQAAFLAGTPKDGSE